MSNVTLPVSSYPMFRHNIYSEVTLYSRMTIQYQSIQVQIIKQFRRLRIATSHLKETIPPDPLLLRCKIIERLCQNHPDLNLGHSFQILFRASIDKLDFVLNSQNNELKYTNLPIPFSQ
jgi:hypothetical protein